MRNVGKSRIVNALIFVLAIFSAFFVMCACSKEDNSGSTGGETDNTTEIKEITWITVSGVTVEYDGEEHGIDVSGVRDGDEVKYSIGGGELSAEEPKCVEWGRYGITVVAERDGFEQFKKSVELIITHTKLVGISANDARFIFDGRPHGIEIIGLKDGDEVSYEVDGVAAETLAVKELGEYDIEYCVERRGEGYYIGKASIEIVPDISGIYVTDREKISVGIDTAIIDGNEYAISYGSNGKGEIIGVGAFTAEDAHFILKEKTYTRPTGSEHIFEFTVGGESVYAISSDGLVRIEFGAAGAELKMDGETIITKAGYNYCEKIELEDGTESQLRRSIETTEVEFDAESIEKITSYQITLSSRKEQELTGRTETVTYDGKPHGISKITDGKMYFKTANDYTDKMPEYTDAGRYEYTVTVERDGYLPKTVTYVLIIIEAKINDGVYVSKSGIIEITDGNAVLNGIDNITVKPSGDGVEYDGNVYNKTVKTYAVVCVKDTVSIMECNLRSEPQIYLTYDYTRIVLDDETNKWTIEYTGEIESVKANGHTVGELSEGSHEYVITYNEYSDKQVVYIHINAQSV